MNVYPSDDGRAALIRLERGSDLLRSLNEAAGELFRAGSPTPSDRTNTARGIEVVVLQAAEKPQNEYKRVRNDANL